MMPNANFLFLYKMGKRYDLPNKENVFLASGFVLRPAENADLNNVTMIFVYFFFLSDGS